MRTALCLTLIVMSAAVCGCKQTPPTREDPATSEVEPADEASMPDVGDAACGPYLAGQAPADLRSCATDADCVKVVEGCCPCNSGGQPVGINVRYEACENERRRRCEDAPMCAQVMLCTDEPARCIEGECRVAEAQPG